MIGQSMININSGGRGRLSGISAAVFLFAFILFAPRMIEMIPIASLVGVMFMVVIATFEWSSLRLIGKVPLADIVVILLVSGVTVLMHNLALGVGSRYRSLGPGLYLGTRQRAQADSPQIDGSQAHLRGSTALSFSVRSRSSKTSSLRPMIPRRSTSPSRNPRSAIIPPSRRSTP